MNKKETNGQGKFFVSYTIQLLMVAYCVKIQAFSSQNSFLSRQQKIKIEELKTNKAVNETKMINKISSSNFRI